jgi:cytoskeletal protein CcmA (bactofilin family)
MKEMYEIRVGESIVGLKDNLVKSAILPKNSVDLDRDINIQENVRIEGPVYARNLIIDSGPVEFVSAVYAHNELHIKNDADKAIFFRKATASSGGIVSLLIKGRCIHGSDINANSVKLKNCFVAGSIFANEIQIENSIVLGGCFGAKKLTLHNVIARTFNALEVNAGGINYLLYPTAFSAEPMSVLPGTKFYNITLADLGSLYKGDAEDAKILLHSYFVAGRVPVSDLINLGDLENHFLIISASPGSQILKTLFPAKSRRKE